MSCAIHAPHGFYALFYAESNAAGVDPVVYGAAGAPAGHAGTGIWPLATQARDAVAPVSAV
jgi:hypothetical protein